jgi:2,3-bisphosphoglycerate-independent phosphoglycerate mutase
MTNLILNRPFQSVKPLLTVILDGVGLSSFSEGNAVRSAHMPHLTACLEKYGYLSLQAHGKAVGLASNEDMGNSEVGHNAIGAGRIFDQGASLIQKAIQDESIFKGETWHWLISDLQQPTQASQPKPNQHQSTLHLIGLLSDGNVHSHLDHLLAILKQAATQHVPKVRIHILLDGRDVSDGSALQYVSHLEGILAGYTESGLDYQIASGGGRMQITMDRYEADWAMVERGWQCHVLGLSPGFESARLAIESARMENPKISDQYLPAFCIVDAKGEPIGKIIDGDSVCLFNFRGDRAIEITRAFEETDFQAFKRNLPQIKYAGMMQYDGDLKLPKRYLVNPPIIDRPLSAYLSANGIRQFACSETQKFGHVTYFWNGNKSEKFNDQLETYVEIKSDVASFDTRPWMKAAEITDIMIKALESGQFDDLRVNFPNGDMVGHTGDYEATRIAMESVDLCLGRLIDCIEKLGGMMIITADHGNAEEMFERDKKSQKLLLDPQGLPKSKTSHTLNPVPFCLVDPTSAIKWQWRYPPQNTDLTKAEKQQIGLANIASTILNLLGFEKPEDYLDGLIDRS